MYAAIYISFMQTLLKFAMQVCCEVAHIIFYEGNLCSESDTFSCSFDLLAVQ